jgi:NADH:ubiquinone reductase (H+-translocating)
VKLTFGELKMKKIVIVGAGYAGILTAKKLAKKFKNKEEVSIKIIDRNSYHTMLTELHEVAAGRVDEDSIKISLSKVFDRRNVEVVMDNVTSIDFEGKKVLGAANNYEYDYLVMASGSKPTYFGTKGAAENAFNLWSYDDAIILKERIENTFRKAAVQSNIEKRKKMLTFYVVGAGFTGVEMIGELAEYAPILCKKHGIPFDQVTLVNVDMLPRVVPILPEKLSNKVEKRLTKLGVTIKLNTGVTEIGEDYIALKVGDVVTRHEAGTVIWAAGIQSADIAYEAGKELPMIGRGRLKTDSFLRAEGKEDVYIVGDNMFYIPEGEEAPVPQMVENCEHSASTAAHNITSAIKGGNMEAYHPSFHGVMVCVGGRYGVARVGLPKFMFNMPSFLAMLSKHFINMIYFMQVLGWNKVVSYCKHEFFTIRNKRSFVGGHFSNRTPSFLLMPLRVFLGGVWLFEGIKKVLEGWMTEAKLDDFFGGAADWYNSITGSVTEVASAGAEAATSASGGGEATGVSIFNFDIFEIIRVMFVSGKEVIDSGLADFALKIDFSPMTWFIDEFVMGNDGLQIVMQIGIVVAEILIGLALIGGLFTFISAAASLVLQVMFIMTTGLYLSTFWMIFAAIAVLIGGGSTLGLDYYAIPALKKGWGKLKFVRKWYVYHD